MKNNNQINVPQAREAMDRFKMQAASEVGVNLTNGYNGHLTSREAGSVGGQMVKNRAPERSKILPEHAGSLRIIVIPYGTYSGLQFKKNSTVQGIPRPIGAVSFSRASGICFQSFDPGNT